jgi:predicted Mrr-cat superfamily restriction endonuclease
MVLEDRRKKEKSTLSVLLNGESVINDSASTTFSYVINKISNLVGKENLYKNFPQVFNKEDFKNSKDDCTYSSGKDDSNNYYIRTHNGTGYKKFILENISKKYNIDLKVNILGHTETVLSSSKKVWLFSPGENAILFDQFYSEGIMALGWDELEDLSQYNSSVDIENSLKNVYDYKNPTNMAGINFSFAKNISIGDIIIAKRGRTEFIGYGEVTSDYYFDNERGKYKSCRDVKWIEKGSWINDTMVSMKTLTDVTTQSSKFLNLIGYNQTTDLEIDNIIENINSVCSATLEIQRCISDNDFLCDKLNQTDKNFISSYFDKRIGVVIDIRKDIAKEIFFGGVKSDKLLEIIKDHKEKNKQKLKSWCNPYKILHPLVNDSYKHIDQFIDNFISIILNKIGDVKYGVSDFNGSQHQGSDNYWIAFYNKSHKHQSDGLQLFIVFKDGQMNYGIYRHIDRVHLSQHTFDGDINRFYQFILDNKDSILNDTEKSKDILLKNVKKILQDNNNIALTSREIVDRLENRIDNNTINNILSSDIFETTEDQKFKLKSYMPTKLKELFENNGFITIDVLKQILEQCGVQVNI